MKGNRIHVDFEQLIDENLVPLSDTDEVIDSKGNKILLQEGKEVLLYSDDLGSCSTKENLIAEGVVEAGEKSDWVTSVKWNCRINASGIYHESQSDH